MRKLNFNIALLLLITFSGINLKCEKEDGKTVQPPPSTEITPDYYLSKPDKSALFAFQENKISATDETAANTITINKNTTYQSMDGFGFSLTGGSALHLFNMDATKRAALLNELFAFDGNNIGVSYLRISVGASDLDAEVFSYNDIPAGQTDENMEQFSIAKDQRYLIPILKEILEINPNIKIMGSPWSAPVWMKTNKASKGGSLLPEYYDAYAKYFVKYVQAMEDEGITIDALTIQNEPLHDGNNPSMYMEAADQAVFVKNHLGPTFETNNIETKIIVYDHNADRPDYPIDILNDADAKKYIDGSAFHLYGGSIDNLAQVHDAHPDKNLYFTEQWIGAPGSFGDDLKWHAQNLIIGGSRNWCKTVLEWNLAANSSLEPYTDGGCTQCLGALTIDGDAVVRNPAYYIIAHASKFVRPGSQRIESNTLGSLANVAFLLPDGKVALIVLNTSESDQTFNVELDEETYNSSIPAGSLATIVF